MSINCIGKNIQMLRENAGFSQSNIAKFLDVDQELISKVEKGKKFPSYDLLNRIATLFRITATELMDTNIDIAKLTAPFRDNNFSANDMETIFAINRIALNSKFMENLIKDKG